MIRLGITLLVMGVLSFILPMMNVQFRLIQLLGDGPEARIGIIAAGFAFLIIGRVSAMRKQAKAAIPAGMPPQYPMQPPPMMQQPQMPPPPYGQAMPPQYAPPPPPYAMAAQSQSQQPPMWSPPPPPPQQPGAWSPQAPPASKVCFGCGSSMPPNIAFCTKCGTQLA